MWLKVYVDLMASIIDKIEKENPILQVIEWASGFEEYVEGLLLTNGKVTENDLSKYIMSVRFDIKPDNPGVDDELFRTIRTDFNDLYASADFTFSIDGGVSCQMENDIEHILEEASEEQFFDAVEEFIPEQLATIQLQWIFSTSEQRTKFISLLVEPAFKEMSIMLTKLKNDDHIFKEFETQNKRRILNITNQEMKKSKLPA